MTFIKTVESYFFSNNEDILFDDSSQLKFAKVIEYEQFCFNNFFYGEKLPLSKSNYYYLSFIR